MPARYRWSRPLAASLALAALGAAACGGGASKQPRAASSPTASALPSPSTAASVDPASVKANELGRVPVLMYHQFLAKPRGVLGFRLVRALRFGHRRRPARPCLLDAFIVKQHRL